MAKKILLSQGKFALVNDKDYDRLNQWKWTYHKTVSKNGEVIKERAVRRVRIGPCKHKILYMHRVITNCPDGLEVDHKNNNGLDNRRKNLRVCTHAENSKNKRARNYAKSKYKGLYKHVHGGWVARAKVDGITCNIGYYKTEVEAAHAYDDFIRSFGPEFCKFARFNFPRGGELSAVNRVKSKK